MQDNDNNPINGAVLLIIGLLIILFLVTSGSKLNSAPINTIDSHNVYTETHTTNVDICGICINSNH